MYIFSDYRVTNVWKKIEPTLRNDDNENMANLCTMLDWIVSFDFDMFKRLAKVNHF